MRIGPKPVEGEFREIGPPDQDRAGRPQPCDHWGILLRQRGIPPKQRAGGRAFAADVEEILDRHQHAIKGRQRHVQPGPLIGGIGRSPRPLARHMKESRLSFAFGIVDPFERRFEAVPDRGAAGHRSSFTTRPAAVRMFS